mmetsp:Transcript_25738/g.36878  ORF Transcript_25738/g.36878 Transcript_25738/m.36878 type:complete len:486 (+) Transcript_25738:85-1542(+)|eukprot:CAMPEP_0172419452 /NCGR_PEP_ID=MMETSP1064-20121228/5891_1 /TAXON_ID=202472 /ORGANISM="Aulacoseira subarctica , Strain CCAP 1002/5" /LENGTH=485 /DNA_ID=CAMNT_0013158947 /DNA_START=25 /DNA_END=1482 /DNA_ORIENTATION=+
MAPSDHHMELTSSSPIEVRAWLKANHSAKLLSALDKFEIELRLGRGVASSSTTFRGISDAAGKLHDGTLNRRIVTSRTVQLFKTLVGSTKWRTAAQLMTLLKGLGRELHAAGGFREPAIGNVVRRIMSCVREEVAAHDLKDQQDDDDRQIQMVAERLTATVLTPPNARPSSSSSMPLEQPSSANKMPRNLSLASMLWAHPQHVTANIKQRTGRHLSKSRAESFSSDSGDHRATSSTIASVDTLPDLFHVVRTELRQAIMEAIQEIANELEDLHKNINDQATNHIHADEVILTYARSETVELFLKAAAAKKRKFQVIVCEGAPHFGGHSMAKSLAMAGIETLVINDSAAFALMARVNKVLLPAHAVLANGGLISYSGAHMVALAAKQNSVPVVCITGMFKLCPQFPHEGQDTLNDLVSPSSVMDYSEMSFSNAPLAAGVEYINPVHDYIPPQLVNLYVTNIGGFQPSYIYRLLAEYYHTDDWESFE